MHNRVEGFYEVGLMDQFELCILEKHNKEHRLGFSFYPSSTQSENGKMTIIEHSQVPDLHQHPHVDLLLQAHEHQCTLGSPTNRLDILDSVDHESNKTTRKIGFVMVTHQDVQNLQHAENIVEYLLLVITNWGKFVVFIKLAWAWI